MTFEVSISVKINFNVNFYEIYEEMTLGFIKGGIIVKKSKGRERFSKNLESVDFGLLVKLLKLLLLHEVVPCSDHHDQHHCRKDRNAIDPIRALVLCDPDGDVDEAAHSDDLEHRVFEGLSDLKLR